MGREINARRMSGASPIPIEGVWWVGGRDMQRDQSPDFTPSPKDGTDWAPRLSRLAWRNSNAPECRARTIQSDVYAAAALFISAWLNDVVAAYRKSSTVAANVPPVKPLAV